MKEWKLPDEPKAYLAPVIALKQRLALVLPASLLLTSCEGQQSALYTNGPYADHIARLIWIFSGLLGGIWLAVIAAMLLALLRPRGTPAVHPLALDDRRERRGMRLVSGLAAVTAVTVLALTGLSFVAQGQLFAGRTQDLLIKVTAHQWWWEIEYEDPAPTRVFATANEIHIPVGIPVRLQLRAADVIHSFWVPPLNGKQDLIPGRENETQLFASRPGIFRGQCAEFCGLQHAHMGILVVAENRADFERWRTAQLRSAVTPLDAEAQEGKRVFLASPCIMCHRVRGTPAGGLIGPDLTHVGSRQTLAAGELPLTRGTLAAWIADPQGIKPGNMMPNVPLSPDELNSVVGYLEKLE